jgi:hypothetical protein
MKNTEETDNWQPAFKPEWGQEYIELASTGNLASMSQMEIFVGDSDRVKAAAAAIRNGHGEKIKAYYSELYETPPYGRQARPGLLSRIMKLAFKEITGRDLKLPS